MASIIFLVPDQEPVEYSLDGIDQVTIGRGPENQIVVDHASLSGSHAVIQNLGGVYQLSDLGSTNGSYLEGEPITEVALYNGARPMLGHVEAVFVDESAEPPASDPSMPEGDSGFGSFAPHRAELAENSTRPPGFTNLSPIPKVVKKDSLAQVAMIIGAVAVVAAIAVAAMAFTLSAS